MPPQSVGESDIPMALLPPGPTHLAVRLAHVLAMATLFGGALLCWWLLRRAGSLEVDSSSSLDVAATYEWLFWAGGGLAGLTGVGNLGALAPAVPGPSTAWGTAFSVKLVGVLVLFLGSLVRTLGVVGLAGRDRSVPTETAHARLRSAYAATALLLLTIVTLAEVMAHG